MWSTDLCAGVDVKGDEQGWSPRALLEFRNEFFHWFVKKLMNHTLWALKQAKKQKLLQLKYSLCSSDKNQHA